MILKTKNLQEVCSKILPAVESSDLSNILDTLQLKVIDKVLCLSVTNKEYFVQVRLGITTDEEFNATVSAKLFLKLISQLTAEDIQLDIENNALVVRGNGRYKFPLIFEGDSLMELPTIEINNVVKSFDISSDILQSILNNNVKELDKGTMSRPIQKLFYVDECGAITFTTGACVNYFELPEMVKLLFNKRLVKLFKLFPEGLVHFKLAYDQIEGSEKFVQTKVQFVADDITITSVLACDDSMINQVPVNAIRNRADKVYPYAVVLDKNDLIQTLSRLMLFTSSSPEIAVKSNILFKFGVESVLICDVKEDNIEQLKYINSKPGITDEYCAVMDIIDLKLTLDTCVDPSVTFYFGDGNAFVLSRGNVRNVIPEVSLN